ncbi:hypothetical protein H1P_1670008 [Hyella patelloides LEGE 07179]|uniref:Uncharacterized protein n=1 Tax=Hyella patelloides LEGE 07179 TaxID=945734 RepID=A0A563VMY4_9CYAN|nr:hypothetical protein H1P_1670008 [Hyella patelloides LEGE 07179]
MSDGSTKRQGESYTVCSPVNKCAIFMWISSTNQIKSYKMIDKVRYYVTCQHTDSLSLSYLDTSRIHVYQVHINFLLILVPLSYFLLP